MTFNLYPQLDLKCPLRPSWPLETQSQAQSLVSTSSCLSNCIQWAQHLIAREVCRSCTLKDRVTAGISMMWSQIKKWKREWTCHWTCHELLLLLGLVLHDTWFSVPNHVCQGYKESIHWYTKYSTLQPSKILRLQYSTFYGTVYSVYLANIFYLIGKLQVSGDLSPKRPEPLWDFKKRFSSTSTGPNSRNLAAQLRCHLDAFSPPRT